ncbi:type II secretion system protein N [Alkalimarinus alittae]|uniref:Type II secretion system protein GspC N-terminal domain-containing protein n=1 Tax=Alkalimarinus alittae TaxID=2961619 RepID=A0ABY6MXB1_9ALTE|nr:type II secretion system protein N [Alkalimarinus alittae]UZE94471.1 hypothetical protein NKI27_10230 [Alkalimarinus alittae]
MNKLALQQKAPVIILIILVAAMLFTLAIQAYDFFMPPNDQAIALAQKKEIKPIQTARPQREIDQFELFGNPADSEQQEAIVTTENLPKTNLRLVLRGVSASNEVERVSALIEGPDKETLKYSINDELPGSAKLKSVHEKRIVIQRNGRLENLYFPEDTNIGIVRNNNAEGSTPNSQTAQSPQPIPVPQSYQRPTVDLDTLSEERKNEIKHRLEQLREKMKQSQQ